MNAQVRYCYHQRASMCFNDVVSDAWRERWVSDRRGEVACQIGEERWVSDRKKEVCQIGEERRGEVSVR